MAENEEEGFSLGWFLAGALVGVAVGMLYAPKSGRESRHFLGQQTEKGRESLRSTGKEAVERGREIYDRGRQIAEDAVDLFERGRRLVRGENAPGGGSQAPAGGSAAQG